MIGTFIVIAGLCFILGTLTPSIAAHMTENSRNANKDNNMLLVLNLPRSTVPLKR